MMFGEADSESPRVPSPWTKPRSSSSRNSNNLKPIYIRSEETSPRGAIKDELEDEELSSPISDDDEDGFFSLDADLDLNKLDLNEVDEKCRSQKTSPRRLNGSAETKRLAPEPDALGNLEYKLRLLPPTRHRYDRLLTQLKWRMLQGGGFCTYEIGVLDDGRCIGICPIEMRASLRVLASLASELGACVRVRRAFMLVESGKGNHLYTLSNQEAQKMLLSQGLQEASIDDLPACNCKGNEDVSAWQESSSLSKFLEAEGVHGSSGYEVDVESAVEVDGPWLGGSDDSDIGEEIQAENLEGEELGQTFSLSLDEMATRQGIGHQRRRARRRCRYQANNAHRRRQKDAVNHQLQAASEGAATIPSPASRPVMIHHAISDGPVETGVLLPSDDSLLLDNKEENGDDIPNAKEPCERLIVEAIVSRVTTDDQSQEFIDYAFL